MQNNHFQLPNLENAWPNYMSSPLNSNNNHSSLMMANQSYFQNSVENSSYQCLPPNPVPPVLNFQYSNILNSGRNIPFRALKAPVLVVTPPDNPPIDTNSLYNSIQRNNSAFLQCRPSQQSPQSQQANQHNQIERKQDYLDLNSTPSQSEWKARQAELQQKIQNWSKQHSQFIGNNLQQYEEQKGSMKNQVTSEKTMNVKVYGNMTIEWPTQRRLTDEHQRQSAKYTASPLEDGQVNSKFGSNEDQFTSPNQTNQLPSKKRQHPPDISINSLESAPQTPQEFPPYIESPPLSEGSSNNSHTTSLSIDLLENNDMEGGHPKDPKFTFGNLAKRKKVKKYKKKIDGNVAKNIQTPSSENEVTKFRSVPEYTVNSIYKDSKTGTEEPAQVQQSIEQSFINEIGREAAKEFIAMKNAKEPITPYLLFVCQNSKAAERYTNVSKAEVLRMWWNTMKAGQKDMYYRWADELNRSSVRTEETEETEKTDKPHMKTDKNDAVIETITISDDEQVETKKPVASENHSKLGRKLSVIHRITTSADQTQTVEPLNLCVRDLKRLRKKKIKEIKENATINLDKISCTKIEKLKPKNAESTSEEIDFSAINEFTERSSDGTGQCSENEKNFEIDVVG